MIELFFHFEEKEHIGMIKSGKKYRKQSLAYQWIYVHL